MFRDEPNREDRSFRRKQDDVLYVFKAKPGFGDGKVKLPLAYVHGQKFDLQLNRLTLRVNQIKDFDQLPIPFRAVATDLETGGEVVLKSGNLARSLRVSMAVPGAFDPVDIDFGDTIFAGSAFIGADTPIGPVYVGYGRSDRGGGSVYLFLGPLFSF